MAVISPDDVIIVGGAEPVSDCLYRADKVDTKVSHSVVGVEKKIGSEELGLIGKIVAVSLASVMISRRW